MPNSSPNAPAHDPNRYAYIDALRGIAALFVIVYHLVLLPNPNLVVPDWIKPLVLSGGTGVSLFFVVSAFTLCASMESRGAEPFALRNFYLRRFFRIAPLFYCWIAATYVRDIAWFGVHQPLWKVLMSASFLYNFVPGEETGFVWASWTLGVEMLFYAAFPLLHRYVTDYRRAATLLFASIVVSGIFHHCMTLLPIPADKRSNFLHFSIFHMLPIFAVGMLVYHLRKAFFQPATTHPHTGHALIAGACFGYGLLLGGKLDIGVDALVWQAIIYGALLLGLSLVPMKVLVNRGTVWLGVLSYSLYLNHPTIIYGLSGVYRKIGAVVPSATLTYFACAAVTFLCLLPVSLLTYHAIEQPGQTLGRRWIKKPPKP